MKMQNMLPNYREREKIIAGLYDITQVTQFGAGCLIGIIIALITYKITGSIVTVSYTHLTLPTIA